MLAVQEELQTLRKTYGSKVHLIKSKGGDGPFHVTVTAEIQAPTDLGMYDVSGFKVSHFKLLRWNPGIV